MLKGFKTPSKTPSKGLEGPLQGLEALGGLQRSLKGFEGALRGLKGLRRGLKGLKGFEGDLKEA